VTTISPRTARTARTADEVPPSADRAPNPRRRIEPPAGQPISGGFSDPLTDEQRRDMSRRLAEIFPFAEPRDFWAKDVRPCAPCTDDIFPEMSPEMSPPLTSPQPEER
jgi:hypothetical protein